MWNDCILLQGSYSNKLLQVTPKFWWEKIWLVVSHRFSTWRILLWLWTTDFLEGSWTSRHGEKHREHTERAHVWYLWSSLFCFAFICKHSLSLVLTKKSKQKVNMQRYLNQSLQYLCPIGHFQNVCPFMQPFEQLLHSIFATTDNQRCIHNATP